MPPFAIGKQGFTPRDSDLEPGNLVVVFSADRPDVSDSVDNVLIASEPGTLRRTGLPSTAGRAETPGAAYAVGQRVDFIPGDPGNWSNDNLGNAHTRLDDEQVYS